MAKSKKANKSVFSTKQLECLTFLLWLIRIDYWWQYSSTLSFQKIKILSKKNYKKSRFCLCMILPILFPSCHFWLLFGTAIQVLHVLLKFFFSCSKRSWSTISWNFRPLPKSLKLMRKRPERGASQASLWYY